MTICNFNDHRNKYAIKKTNAGIATHKGKKDNKAAMTAPIIGAMLARDSDSISSFVLHAGQVAGDMVKATK